MDNNQDYNTKYLKYKEKYLALQNEYNELIIAKQNMIGGNNIKIDGMGFNNYNKFINPNMRGGNAINSKVTVILFKADWCGHCKHFKPTWEKISETYNKKFNFVVYDADKQREKFEEYKVDAFPTVLVKNGSNIVPYDGDHSFGDFNDFLNNF
jgi:thiol-disulfide isomerase/thioredoxin